MCVWGGGGGGDLLPMPDFFLLCIWKMNTSKMTQMEGLFFLFSLSFVNVSCTN